MILARGVAGERSAVLDRVLSLEHCGARPAAGGRDGVAGEARRVAGADARHRRWPVSSACSSAAARSMSPALRPRRSTCALIMALAPLRGAAVLVSCRARKPIHRSQIIGMLLSLAGAGLIITRGQAAVGAGVAIGDLLATDWRCWAGRRIHLAAEPRRQRRELSGADRPVRGGRRAVLAALRHPRNVVRAISRVQRARGAGLSLRRTWSPACLPIRPTPGSARKFGAVSTSLSLYLGPIVSAVLSILFLGEAPIRDPSDRRRAVARRHVVEPAGQAGRAA